MQQLAASALAAADGSGADQSSVGATDSSGSYTSNDGVGAPVVASASPALEMLEPSQNLNADGVIGLAVTSGETVEVSSANSDPATFTGSSGILQLDQSASFSGTVSGMTGQDTLDLKDISFATIQSPTYSGTSTGGTLSVSDGTPVVASASPALEMLEPSQNLNAEGVIGLAVMSGETVEVSSANSGPATFTGSSGILQLDQSASFSGTVSGMTGQDTLDLRDISFATIQSPTYSGTSTGGTLSVSDGTHNAKIALLGNYLASTFVASSDGHGGTNIVDPSSTPFHGGLDVTKYGVVGDGTTDDTQKLQALVSSSPNGTVFYFPAGTYLVSNTIHFSQGYFGIVGDLNPDGSPASILKSNTPNVTVADATAPGEESFQISNMEFWASNQGGIGFYSQVASVSTIENSAFKGYIGLYNDMPFEVALRNDEFLGDGGNNGSHIGYLANLSTESLIENSDFSGWDEGVRVSGAGMSMIGSTFEHNGIGLNGGIDKDGNAWFLRASTMTNLTFSDNDIGIKLVIGANDSLSNSQITGSTNAPSGQSSIGLYANYIQQSQVTGLQVSGSYSNSAVQIDSGATNDSFHANAVTNSNPTGEAWNIAANLSNVVVDSALLPGQAAITDGAAPSWYPSPGANIVDVTAHGVVGDNLTDDAAALQALVNSSPNGTIFYFPKGVYRLYSTVDFSRLTNFAIIGDEPAGPSLYGSSIVGYFSSGPLIEANYASTGGTFHISDVSLRSVGNTAFASQNAVSSSIENVNIGGNIGIRLDNPVQVSLSSVNFNPLVDPRSVSLVGNNNLALVINGGHDNWLEQISVLGFQEAIRATGDNLHVFSSRFEVNHIGLNLGVAPDGSMAPLTNSTFAGITEEANDTGFNLADVQNSYFESITGQGSSNAPTGMSITGIAIGDLSKNVTFAATEFEGDFTQQALLVAPNADTIRFADTAFGNTLGGQSTVIQNATTTFSNSGATSAQSTAIQNTTTTFSNSGVTSAPTVQVSIDHSDVNIATQTALVTFAFNEPTDDFSILGSTTVNGGALSNLQTTDGGNTYTATFTPTADTAISNASVDVTPGSYHDLAGQAGTGGSTPLFTVNTVTPTVTVDAQSLLLSQYMASSFSQASDDHGGSLITDPALTQQSQLTLPHALSHG